MSLAVAARTIVVCLMLVGLSGCETFLGTQSGDRFPPPGKLVEIEGRKLQIDCRGSGSPTVVLESGGSDIYGSLGWPIIKDAIAATTRVCSYSRAGYMWSDSRSVALDAEGVSRDLHAALQLTHETPPFVLVSHSRGALFSLIFTDLFNADVAAMVFVEPRPPEVEARRAQAGIKQTDDQPLTSVKVLRALRWTGLPHAFSGYCELPSLSKQDIDACKAWFPHSLDGIISENEALESVRARAAKVHDLGSRPVLVLTRQGSDDWYNSDPATKAEKQKSEKLWSDLHAEIASWSSHGEQRFVLHSAHNMPSTHPQAVVDGVRDVVVLVRQSTLKN